MGVETSTAGATVGPISGTDRSNGPSLAPGLVLAALITAAAFALADRLPGSAAGPMILALIVGILFHAMVGTPACAAPGLRFAGKGLLRAAVALLGVQITFTDIALVGAAGLVSIAATLVVTFLVTIWLARVLGVPGPLGELLAAGTSICGASAIAAANTATRAGEEDVAYAVAAVTLFGTVLMVLLPPIADALDLAPAAAGLWFGAAVHEVAQVVGAGFARGAETGEAAVVAKLARVLLLAPVVLVLVHLARRRGRERETAVPAVPGFIVAFALLVALNSAGLVPDEIRAGLAAVSPVLLALALGAIGLGTDLRNLRARGWRPLALAGLATLVVAAVSLGLVVVVA